MPGIRPGIIPSLEGLCADFRSQIKADVGESFKTRIGLGYPIPTSPAGRTASQPRPRLRFMIEQALLAEDVRGAVTILLSEGDCTR
jgi:hypothetical protein